MATSVPVCWVECVHGNASLIVFPYPICLFSGAIVIPCEYVINTRKGNSNHSMYTPMHATNTCTLLAGYTLGCMHGLEYIPFRVGSKGHDSNLPAIVTIRAGSKGHDLNLPAIVTISTGSYRHD